MQQLPSYEAMSARFGFPPLRSYYAFLETAFRLNPGDPWNAFAAFDILYLDAMIGNPDYPYPGHDYPDTPVEVYVFGWTRTDCVHFGFVVDDLPRIAGC